MMMTVLFQIERERESMRFFPPEEEEKDASIGSASGTIRKALFSGINIRNSGREYSSCRRGFW
jgi:hypothetical protein